MWISYDIGIVDIFFGHLFISTLLFQKITDDDLVALMSDEVFQPQFVWQLQNVQVDINVDYICTVLTLIWIKKDGSAD